MKSFTLKVFVVAMLALALGGGQGVKACNLAGVTLCGVYKAPLLNASFPADSMVCLRLSVGWGKTGTGLGADSDTRSISFGWWTHRSGFEIRAFSPLTITSGRGFADCTMPGIDIGPQPVPPYFTQATIVYVDPGYYHTAPCVLQPYACVTSTALCGNIGSNTTDYLFQVNKIPDSVRVYGIEGAGNPIDGCYPDADMMFNFTTLAVEWGNIEGIATENAIKVKWATISETNSEFFAIERVGTSGVFEEIGTVNATGYSAEERRYEFVDLAPMPGINRYRILQLDEAGNSDASQAIEVNFAGPTGLVWGAVGPNPAADFLNLTFYNDQSESLLLTVSDMNGKSVIRQEISANAGANAIRLALDKVDAGAYFVSLNSGSEKLTRKIVKL